MSPASAGACAATPDPNAKPELSERERNATQALMLALGFRVERSYAEGEDGLYYVIDTNKAEPEVNHPGELVAGPVDIETASAIRQQEAARAILDFVDRGLLTA